MRAELDRILASREFAGAERLSRFLRFVVERTLAGDRDSLKESIIGTEVFDRELGYDPKAEPVVRTSALRLRAKLEEYYGLPGRPYTVRITIPKGGYVAAFEPRPQPVVVPAPEVYDAPKPAPPRFWPVAAGVAVLAAIAFFALRSPGPHSQPVPSTVTSYPGRQQQPALSPDGSQVAFVWDGEAAVNQDIYIAMAAGGAPRRITTDPGADTFPAWSPDGSQLAFVHENRFLMLITPLGTNQRQLTSAYNTKLSWTPDGKRIAFSDWLPNHGPLAIFLADVASGARHQVSAPGAASPGDVLSEISPDGREIAFVRADRTSYAIYRVPVGGGEPRLVYRPAHGDVTGITWSPDSRHIIYAGSQGAVYLLWSVPAVGGTPQVIALTGEDNRNPSFGRSRSSRLVWEHSLADSNIWRLDLESHHAERIVASTRLDSSPQLSPDGQSLVFVSDRTGSYQLWRSGADGSNPVQLTKYSYEYPGSARWSPDGNRIAFDLRTEQGRAIFVMDLATGATRQWTAWREGSRPSWSRDGRWIYFGDRAPDNTFEIWKAPAAAPGEPERITHGGGWDPFDSPDGKTIYFSRDDGGMWTIPAAGGPVTPGGPEHVQGGWFSVTARGLFFADLYPGGAPGVSVPNTPKPILLLTAPGAKPIEVGKIEGAVTRDTPDFTMSPDGRTAYFSILETSASQIRMLEGWQ